MTTLRARSRWWWGMAIVLLLLLIVSTTGCTVAPRPATPPDIGTVEIDVIVDRSAILVMDANALYEEVVIQSSRAYFNGTLDGETFNAIKKAAEKVERAIRAAKAGVEVYSIVRSPNNAAGAAVLLDALEVVKDELDTLWEANDGDD